MFLIKDIVLIVSNVYNVLSGQLDGKYRNRSNNSAYNQ